MKNEHKISFAPQVKCDSILIVHVEARRIPLDMLMQGFMTPAERLAIIRAVVAQLEISVQEFSAASVEAEQKEIPEDVVTVVAYQLKTLDLGLYYHQCMLAWFEKFAMELEAELGGELT
ncbi:hypothetical protein [Paenibacillus sp. LPE1-1-1.1]|uniref:hypothetical protein n=1 Tax=Paenibacillus sp. LPE1-1-1.1 TaxID=3135230 RepID=UPI00343B1354